MEFKDLKELKEFLCGCGHEDAIVFENPDFLDAVVGTDERGRVVYDYGLMLECLMLEDGMEYDDAIEFVDYNTIRALPYMGEMAPVILYGFDED